MFYHATLASNLIKAFDKYTLTFDKSKLSNLTYKELYVFKEETLGEILEKYKGVLSRHGKDGDYIVILGTSETTYRKNDITGTGIGYYSEQTPTTMKVDKVYNTSMEELVLEEVLSDSYLINYKSKDFVHYNHIRPRSISFLPIAIGCNASCPFCFSKNSVSLVAKQKLVPVEVLKPYYEKAKEIGVNRSVITGGGEPSLVKKERLYEYIRFMKEYVDRVIMISNGQVYTKGTIEETLTHLKELEEQGLDVLSISRHGYNNENNTEIMYLDTNTEQILNVQDKLDTLKIRLICVLQKKGVEDEQSLTKYLDFASKYKVKEINFKELYVSTSNESMYYDKDGNEYCRINQVPLQMVINYLEKNGATKIGELPWGSPIYKYTHKGHEIQIACYTEPSVYWEQINKIARSWNILSDGRCYGSLEVTDSLVDLNKFSIKGDN